MNHPSILALGQTCSIDKRSLQCSPQDQNGNGQKQDYRPNGEFLIPGGSDSLCRFVLCVLSGKSHQKTKLPSEESGVLLLASISAVLALPNVFGSLMGYSAAL